MARNHAGGVPEHIPSEITRAEVQALRSYGVPQEDISVYLDIDSKTLRKHYREELDKACIAANLKVRKYLFNAATGKAIDNGATHSDCLRAAMFWGKTQMGMRENDPAPVSTDNEIKITYEVIK